ncbi:hypothetical protein [Neolewinella persica]|uniref:hypothetical protein n=1 Tax=Neolewinella persica TaxID=70998 RepID=UPI000360E674|nr:hypothetical protein [Neolewinella persica]
MHRFLLSLLFLTFLCTSVRAQVLTVSDELIMRSDTEYDLIGKLGGQVLLMQDRDTKHLLTAFDRNMRQSWEKELELRGRNIRLLTTVSKQDGTGFHLVYIFRNGGRNFLQLDEYNPAGNLKDSTTLVDFGVFTSAPEDEIYRSEDETKLLLMISEQQNKTRCIGLDLSTMSLLYDHELEPEKFFFSDDFMQAEISNTGELFFVIERDNFKSKRKEHKYEVMTLAPNLSFSTFELPMGDSLTYDIYFRYDNKNKTLTAGGLYTTKDFTQASGYFWINVDPKNASSARPDFTPFPLTLVRNIEGKKYNKKSPGIDELSVRDLVLRQDGGGLIITERNRQLERRSNASRTQVINNYGIRPLVDYHYDELIVFSVHPDGNTHWTNILHKKQYSQDDGGVYSSYFLMENPRSLRFLFNDEIRFENTVSEYVVNGRGEFDRNSLFHTRDLDLRLRFRDGVQVAANEMILPSEHRNRLRLVKMTYEVK